MKNNNDLINRKRESALENGALCSTHCNWNLYETQSEKNSSTIKSTRSRWIWRLIGDPSKAKNTLDWVAENDLASLVKDMIQSDVKLMQKEQYLKAGDYHLSTNLE